MFFEVFLFALLAGMSPGPDFFIVTKNAMGYGKKIGIATAIGVASALVIHATYSILGLTIIMNHYHTLFVIIQLFGAAYLAYLGISSILSSFKKKNTNTSSGETNQKIKGFREGLLNGFLCNILNPKAYLFFLSVFSQFMSASTPLWIEWVYAAEVIFVIGLWFCFLSIIISAKQFKKAYNKAEKWIDRFFGAILLLFAIKITKSALAG
jgi:RhtB (resistance to homoserine/threonine) family protein